MEFKEQIINYLNVVINENINLIDYAKKNGINIYVNGNLDKGWKGNVVEHLLNLKKNNKKGADYIDLEIKTVPVIFKDNQWKAKETTCLSVLETNDVIKYSFEKSPLYKKINKTLLVLIDVTDDNYPKLCDTYYLDMNQLIELKNNIQLDYEEIAEHILDNIQSGLDLDTNFSGKIGKTIQPRPKTGKNGSYTWAFYLKTHVLNDLLKGKSNKFKIK